MTAVVSKEGRVQAICVLLPFCFIQVDFFLEFGRGDMTLESRKKKKQKDAAWEVSDDGMVTPVLRALAGAVTAFRGDCAATSLLAVFHFG